MNIVLNEGVQLIDTSTTRSLTLYIDEARNVITFLYQKYDATFEYQIVCDDIDGSGVGLSMTRDVINAGSDATLDGSIPYESETYYFAGWFADAECKIPVNTTDHAVILGENNRLTPTKTSFTYTDENGNETPGNLYISTTYYALFLPRSADLKVTVTSDQSDSFILTFSGQSGTFAEGTTFTVAVIDGETLTVTDVPIGVYNVVSDANWSWRYSQINTTVTVEVSVGGELEVSLTPDNSQWLTANSNGVYSGTTSGN
jgi:hypothetical protein